MVRRRTRFGLRAPSPPKAPEVLDLLDSLVDRSPVLVDEVAEGLRYRLLETVRAYAGEKLAASGELTAVRKRHRDWYLQLAERGRAAGNLPEQREWLLRLERELDNFRAALRACHEAARQGDRTAAAAGVRLASALYWFWVCRGYLAGGLGAFETALADGADLPAAARAPTLTAAANVAAARGDSARSETFRQQSRDAHEAVLQAARGEGERQEIATTLLSLVETCF